MAAPVLPLPPKEYTAQYFNEYNRILTLFFRQQQNPGPIQGSTLNLSQLPTSAAGLRKGDVWVDSGAGNVLKLVP